MKAVIFVLCFMGTSIIGSGQLSETYKNKALVPTMKKPGFQLTSPNDNQLILPQKKKK